MVRPKTRRNRQENLWRLINGAAHYSVQTGSVLEVHDGRLRYGHKDQSGFFFDISKDKATGRDGYHFFTVNENVLRVPLQRVSVADDTIYFRSRRVSA